MREESSNSAGIKFLRIDYEKVFNYLKEYAERIVKRGDAELVILFGSLARGDYTATSDADVLVISSKAKDDRFIDRPLKFMDPKAPIPLEPKVLTIEEAVKMSRRKERFMKDVLQKGIILAGDTSLYRNLLKLSRD